MPSRITNGIITPQHRAGKIPSRVVNVKSRKAAGGNTRIRLDRLFRSETPRILIKRRLGGIGDVIMTTPMLRAIKKLIPHCELTYATDTVYSNGALLDAIEHCPYVDVVVQNGTVQDNQYDYSVDVTATGLGRERQGTVPPNRIDMFAEEVGVSIEEDPVPIYMLRPEEIKLGKQEINELIPKWNKKKKLIAIQAKSNDARRTWPLDNMQGLMDSLSDDIDYEVLFFDWGTGISRWQSNKDNVHLIMNRTLNETARLINECDVVVCPDSSMLHLAGALNKRIVTIFGPIPHESRINHYPNATAVQKVLPCSGCWYTPRCRKNSGMTLECLTSISVAEVKVAINKKITEEIKTGSNMKDDKGSTKDKQFSSILVRRKSPGIGDILMITPALEALKARYPERKLEVACQKKLWPILDNNPNVDKLLSCDDNFNYKKYFLVLDISYPCARYESIRVNNRKSVQKSRVEIFAEAMNVRNEIKSIVPQYIVADKEEVFAKDFIKSNCKNNKPNVAIALHSAESYRDLPEEHYKDLFSYLEDDYNLILIDPAKKGTYNNTVDASGFNIKQAVAILAECDGLITVDTSMLHFAAALNIPTIALFGPIDYKARCKGYKNVTVVLSGMDCSPCWRNSSIACKHKKNINENSKCMEELKPKQIALAVKGKFK